MSRPAEKIMRPLNLKRPLVASPSLDSGSSGIIKLKFTRGLYLSDNQNVKLRFIKKNLRCDTKVFFDRQS